VISRTMRVLLCKTMTKACAKWHGLGIHSKHVTNEACKLLRIARWVWCHHLDLQNNVNDTNEACKLLRIARWVWCHHLDLQNNVNEEKRRGGNSS
jgi:hypothetical protein